MTADKLRGGFYTPDVLVRRCLDRVAELLPEGKLSILEPSAGDGAFFRGLETHALRQRVTEVVAIEPEREEAAKCESALRAASLDHRVLVESCITWACETNERFDVAVGNPPFLRYQYLPEADRASISSLGNRIDASFKGVSNLWIPVLLGALDRLRPGGAFAFVLPVECFTGISAGIARSWLLARTERLTFDLFPPGSFPGVLQEVAVMSGRITHRFETHQVALTINEGSASGSRSWSHIVPVGPDGWTRYLLTPAQLDALRLAESLATTTQLGKLARFEVATVTGANEFFSVTDEVLDEFQLHQWALPLLPRIRHATGLVYNETDHEVTASDGMRAHLLSFSTNSPSPENFKPAREYLARGLAEELPERYKCRIRDPWYRVPVVQPGTMLLSKRSHRYPRLVLNEAGVVTTDTIYRGTMLNGTLPDTLVATFHNSLTLLSAELEGRSFGGGVLELVPSEVARLCVPLVHGFESEIDRLDRLAREGVEEAVVEETDLLLEKAKVGLDSDLMDTLRDARSDLMARRLLRNHASSVSGSASL
jgi:hypothetical protein